MRISDYLALEQIPFDTLLHPPAYTAQRRAKYLRVPGSRVVKAVLLRRPAGFALALLPATHRIDLAKLADTGGGPLRLADANEVAAVFTDCEWGVAAPLGSRYGVPTYLDDSLESDALVVMELHHRHEAIRLRLGDFESVEKPHRLRFAVPPSPRS